MKQAYIFLVDGFEEIEALATVDILRRGEIDVQMVSITGHQMVTGGHNIAIKADVLFENTDFANAEMLILPGGTVKINEFEPLKQLLVKHNAKGGLISAICAAPMVLGGLGLLKGRKATCYPGFEQYLAGAEFIEQPTVKDGNILTGRGPGFTFDFALAIVEILCSQDARQKVEKQLLID